MVKYLSVILVVLATLFRAQAATSSGVQVVGQTNLLAGTVTISNAVPSTVIGVDAGKKLVSTLLTTLEANALHGTEAVLSGTTPTLTWATNSVSYFQSISADTTFVFANTPTDTNLVKRIDYWLIGDGTHVLTNTANTISFEPTFPGVIPTGTNLIRFTWVGGLVHADVTWKQNATDGLVAQVGGTMTNATVTSELSLSGNTLGVGATLSGKILVTPTIASLVNATHNHQSAAGGGSLDAAAVGSGVFAIGRLATGTPDGTKFVRDDGTLAVPAGGGGGTTTPRLSPRHWRLAQAIHGGDMNSVGIPVFALGTSSTIAPTSSEPVVVNYATAATTGDNAAFHNNGNSFVRVGRNIYFSTRVKLQETAATRVWIGAFFSAAATVLGADSNNEGTGFRYSTVAGDTNFKCITSTGSAQTVTDSGVAADTALHLFEIVCTDSVPNVKFYIDGTLVATTTTNLTPSGDNLQTVVGEQTQANVVKNIRIAWVYVEGDL